MNKPPQKIGGKVLDATATQPLTGITVEARDADGVQRAVLWRAKTVRGGQFEITLRGANLTKLLGKRQAELVFALSRDGTPIASNGDKVRWTFAKPNARVTIEIQASEADRSLVSGRVKTTRGVPVPGLTVKAFEQKVLHDPVLLEAATTGDDGAYVIDYTARVQRGEVTTPLDLYVECLYKAGSPPLRSDLIIAAAPTVSVNLKVPDHVRLALTEIETVERRIRELIGDRDPRDLKEEDQRYLAAKLGVDVAKIRRFVRAHALRARALELKRPPGVSIEALYALCGEETATLDALLAQPRAELRRTLLSAVEKELVPAALTAAVEQILTAMGDLAAELDGAGGKDDYTVSGVASLVPQLGAKPRSRLVREYLVGDDADGDRWSRIEKDPELAPHVPALRDLVTLGEATAKNFPLVRALHSDRRTVRDLAKLDVTDFREYLSEHRIPMPERAPGQRFSLEEYAEHLSGSFRKLHPTVALLSDLQRSAVLDEGDKPSRALLDLLDQHPDFAFGQKRVGHFLRDSGIRRRFADELGAIKDAEPRAVRRREQQALIGELQRIDLAHMLVPAEGREDCVVALLALRLEPEAPPPQTPRSTPTRADSAHRIATQDAAAFARRWRKVREAQGQTDTRVIRAEAQHIHHRARFLALRTLLFAWNAASIVPTVAPAVVMGARSRGTVARTSAALSDGGSEPLPERVVIADLETLFGGADTCECAHCLSIYGPGAYFKGLFDDLGDVQSVLLARRPDLGLLHLDCENTDTRLPQIDLVNELLEVLVARKAVTDRDRQTTRLEEELALRPEHEESSAYVILSSLAYPLSLPWDKWFEEGRLYLDYLGLPLHRLAEVVQPLPPNTGGPFDVGLHRTTQRRLPQVVSAHLGAATPLFDLITKAIGDSDEPTTYDHSRDNLLPLFGVVDATDAVPLRVFIQKLGLTRGDDKSDTGIEAIKLVREILGSKYIQDSGALSTLVIDIAFKDQSCDLDQAEIQNLNQAAIIRTVKFEHLRRLLGWRPAEVTRAILTFTGHSPIATKPLPMSAIDEALLVHLSHVVRLLERRPRSAVTDLLSWWGPLDTGAGQRPIGTDYEGERQLAANQSLYDRVFLRRELFGTEPDDSGNASARAFFELDSSRTELLYLKKPHAVPIGAQDHDAVIAGAPPPLPIKIEQHAPLIAAALELSAADWDALFASVARSEAPKPTELRLETLAALYRRVSLSRYVDLDMQDFVRVSSLLSGEIDPFNDPVASLQFVEAVEQLKRSPFTIRDVAYLLHHRTESTRELVDVVERTNAFLERLKPALRAARAAAPTPPAPTAGAEPPPDPRVLAVSAALARELATFLELSVEQARALAGLGLAPGAPGEGVEAAFQLCAETAPVAAAAPVANAPVANAAPDTDAVLLKHLRRLDKLALLARGFQLTPAEVAYVRENPAAFHGFSLASIPIEENAPGQPTFRQWSALATYVDLRNRLAVRDDDLVKLFRLARAASDPALDIAGQEAKTAEVLPSLAALLLMRREDLQPMAASLGYLVTPGPATAPRLQNDAFTSAESLLPLVDAVDATRRSGRPFAQLAEWARVLGAPLRDPRSDSGLTSVFPRAKAAVEQIRNAVRAVSGGKWTEVARERQDRMRVLQRDKLLDALTAGEYPRPGGREPLACTDDVYDSLLIDPLVSSCVETTRLKHAIGSVQLLIHRVLMGLEGPWVQGELQNQPLGDDWKWKRSYRVWEAARKVFLYPENWLEPELRDDKTPFFVEFEDELSQSEIGDRTIEKAYQSYLRKVDEVGNLEVAAFLEHAGELHVIGRTRDVPRTHYYRKRTATGVWLPWERTQLDIDSDVVLLTFHHGTPYAFWPSTKQRVQKLGQDNPDDENNDKKNYRPLIEIRFNWSRYVDGRWLPKRRTEKQIDLLYDWKYHELCQNPVELIEYDVVGTSDDIRISVHIIATGSDDVKRCTWDDTALECQFQEVYDVIGRTDWSYIQGHDNWNLGATEVTDILRGPLEMTKLLARMYLYAGDGPSACDLINTLGGGNGIIDTFLDDNPDQVGNKDGGKGLKSSDTTRINRLTNDWDDNTEDIDVRTFTYRWLTIGDHLGVGLDANRRCTIGRMTFAGYRLEEKAQAHTGLLARSRSGGGAFVAATAWVDDLDYGVHVPASSTYTSVPRGNGFEIIDGEGKSLNLNTYTVSGDVFAERPLFVLPESEIRITTGYPFGQVLTRCFIHDSSRCFELAKSFEFGWAYDARPFYHPWIGSYNEVLDDRALSVMGRFDLLLTLDRQGASEPFPYAPGPYLSATPDTKLELAVTEPLGAYNWELFFHMPFTVAVRLSQNREFEAAQRWFHYIFNPLQSYDSDNTARFWNFLPLHELDDVATHQQVDANDLEARAHEVELDPFQPHRLARLRPVTYQKAVVMKYLDNLIAWGDDLFARDTIETINEATQLYVLAARTLGPRPVVVPKPRGLPASAGGANGTRGAGSAAPPPPTVLSLHATSPARARMEEAALASVDDRILAGASAATLSGGVGSILTMQWYRGEPPDDASASPDPVTVTDEPAFCFPHNDKLLSYWDTVADRLFKIRNCRNLAGQVRELPIFEPPIDPALLVRGAALHVDLGDLLSALYTPLPPYRFRVMLAKALELCGVLQRLGGSLLAALEKRDAEDMSLLRTRHERELLRLTETQKRQQLDELKENVAAAGKTRDMAEARRDYYASRAFENSNEKSEVTKLNIASGFNVAGQAFSVAASVAHAIPDYHVNTTSAITIIQTGGKSAGDALAGMSQFLSMISALYSHEANMHSIQGTRERRMDDWKFQADQAKKEIEQTERQLLASEIRLAIAEKELESHRKQQEQAEEIEAFMKSKFTNRDLYHWLASQTSTLYFQTYKLVLDAARRAELCYQIEQRDDGASFVGTDRWDNLKQGLLAGERLELDLRRMEAAYFQRNSREVEVEKSISLASLAPVQLDLLRYQGTCTFQLPELLFDLDYPGHYYRRIKSVSVSIPAVVGPYSTIACQLTLKKSATRRGDGTNDLLDDDPSYLWGQSVFLSAAQDDSGVFELRHDDDRYLPFELRGVAGSEWQLEFPSLLASFDRTTISDVILKVRYTAQNSDSNEFRTSVATNITTAYQAATSTTAKPNGMGSEAMGHRIAVRRELPDLWSLFRKTGTLLLSLTTDLFPYLVRPLITGVKGIALICETEQNDARDTIVMGAYSLVMVPERHARGTSLYQANPAAAHIALPGSLTLSVNPAQLDPKTIRDLTVVLFL